jgi:hypothetical protein
MWTTFVELNPDGAAPIVSLVMDRLVIRMDMVSDFTVENIRCLHVTKKWMSSPKRWGHFVREHYWYAFPALYVFAQLASPVVKLAKWDKVRA